MASEPRKNGRTALLLSLVGAGMFGFGFAMVPLYGLICQVAGIQSAQRAVPSATAAAEHPTGRMVTVRFDATVNRDLPWRFEPKVKTLEVQVGKMAQAAYVAHNYSSRSVVGQAIPAVVPWQATAYFEKNDCFCFNRQLLQAGETKEMPLVFVVSRDLPADVDSITLSYTFMNADTARERGNAGNEPTGTANGI